MWFLHDEPINGSMFWIVWDAHRSAMVTKLLQIPVCMVHFHSSGTQTVNKWTDADGVHESHQHEDGEQGHPPHAFAL